MNINKAKLMQDLQAQLDTGERSTGFQTAIMYVQEMANQGTWDCDEVSDSDMKSLQERLEHKDKQIEWLVRDFAEMRNDRDKYKQDVVGLRRGNEILHKKINELTGNLDEHRAALKQSEGRGDILVRDIQQTNEHWHREIGASEKKRMQLESDIKSYQEQIVRLQEKNMDFHHKIQGLLAPSLCEDVDDNTVNRAVIIDQRQQLETLIGTNHEQSARIASLEKQLEECEAMSEKRFYQACEWQKERDALKLTVYDLRERMDAIKKVFE